MKQYTKGQVVKLSNDFNSIEFDCHGNGCCCKTYIDENLVEYLQMIRNHFRNPVNINSAYRCEKHNAAVGGVSGSRHKYGQAADISVKGISPAEVAKYAESIGVLGIGLYEGDDGNFVHIDTRDYKSFWYGHKQERRETFGGTAKNNSANAMPYPMLRLGDCNEYVTVLQNKLINLGYSCGIDGADGEFGNNTLDAVKKFQTEAHQKYNGVSKLTVDGIVGEKTWFAIDKARGAKPYMVRVAANYLNIRQGAGTNYPIVGTIKDQGSYTIVEEALGIGATKWGLLKSYANSRNGWISLDYCQKVQ